MGEIKNMPAGAPDPGSTRRQRSGSESPFAGIEQSFRVEGRFHDQPSGSASCALNCTHHRFSFSQERPTRVRGDGDRHWRPRFRISAPNQSAGGSCSAPLASNRMSGCRLPSPGMEKHVWRNAARIFFPFCWIAGRGIRQALAAENGRIPCTCRFSGGGWDGGGGPRARAGKTKREFHLGGAPLPEKRGGKGAFGPRRGSPQCVPPAAEAPRSCGRTSSSTFFRPCRRLSPQQDGLGAR